MAARETIGRAAPLPPGVNYSEDGTPVFAYIPGAREVGPVERILAARPQSPEADVLDIALDDFATATLLLEEARNLVDRTARKARAGGATWSQIGRRAGITPQSAQQRWSEEGNHRHNERRKQRLNGLDARQEATDG